MKRHLFLRGLAACACAAGLLQAVPARAQNWPTHPVRIIVPFAAGGPPGSVHTRPRDRRPRTAR